MELTRIRQANIGETVLALLPESMPDKDKSAAVLKIFEAYPDTVTEKGDPVGTATEAHLHIAVSLITSTKNSGTVNGLRDATNSIFDSLIKVVQPKGKCPLCGQKIREKADDTEKKRLKDIAEQKGRNRTPAKFVEALKVIARQPQEFSEKKAIATAKKHGVQPGTLREAIRQLKMFREIVDKEGEFGVRVKTDKFKKIYPIWNVVAGKPTDYKAYELQRMNTEEVAVLLNKLEREKH